MSQWQRLIVVLLGTLLYMPAIDMKRLSLSSELSSLCHLARAGTRSCVTGMTACATRRSWDNTMITSLLLRRLRTRGILRFLFQLLTWVIESASCKRHIKTEHLTLSITTLFPLYPKNIALPLESCIWCMLVFLFPRAFFKSCTSELLPLIVYFPILFFILYILREIAFSLEYIKVAQYWKRNSVYLFQKMIISIWLQYKLKIHLFSSTLNCSYFDKNYVTST